jgi:three-Cys-motif partner protein
MKHQRFGGNWTQEKLERVRKYLKAYTTIFANNPKARYLKPIYVDAFAGSGYRASKRKKSATNDFFPEFADTDTQAFVKGSARIALEIDPQFKGYLFIEQDEGYTQEFAETQAGVSRQDEHNRNRKV